MVLQLLKKRIILVSSPAMMRRMCLSAVVRFHGESFIADGEEVQTNDKRYGISANYNSDTKTFSFASNSVNKSAVMVHL